MNANGRESWVFGNVLRENFEIIDRLPKVRAFKWMVGARFPNNGLGLESPATIQYARTFGRQYIPRIPFSEATWIGFALIGVHLSVVALAKSGSRLNLREFGQVSP